MLYKNSNLTGLLDPAVRRDLDETSEYRIKVRIVRRGPSVRRSLRDITRAS